MIKQLLLCCTAWLNLQTLMAQETMTPPAPANPKVAGFHVGVVQIIFGINKNGTSWIDESDFYSIGFPMGITLNTSGKAKIDLEFVPVIKPHMESDKPFQSHLLFHPGILLPMKHGWTFGMRLAFEAGEGQFGFTPLLNKSFPLGKQSV
ncbi:MAG TPA: hypothetical protein VJ508_01875, partial [Saprospiraceae bacterium]|nr:hypothetical protein [Saprospiraceae bacterium]